MAAQGRAGRLLAEDKSTGWGWHGLLHVVKELLPSSPPACPKTAQTWGWKRGTGNEGMEDAPESGMLLSVGCCGQWDALSSRMLWAVGCWWQ